MNQLEIAWRDREGGGGATKRAWLDFMIDGSSLHDRLEVADLDLIGGFGWGEEEGRLVYLNRLLLREPPGLESGRVPLFVCPECGDIGCGAITIRLEKVGQSIRWSDFGYENDYDPETPILERYRGVGPFVFPFEGYVTVLEAAAKKLASSASQPQDEAVQIAADVLRGDVGVIEGSRRLARLATAACGWGGQVELMEKHLPPREAELYRRCDEVLHYLWDPIGVREVPQTRDEYNSYLPQVFGLVRDGAPEDEIASYLLKIETERMGLTADPKNARVTADTLTDWRDSIWEESETQAGAGG